MAIDLGFFHVTVHGVDLARWCERYNIRPFVGDCMDCGAPLPVDVPIAGWPDYRGLRADPCPLCGCEDVPFTFTRLEDPFFQWVN